ncbi:pleiotropic drug resistance protein [Trifolium repens]|nr:pleiotropic drug resistance protein [Trifolium repens]
MEAEMVEEDIVRPMSEGRKSVSFGELIRNSANEEEEELKWEALWRLPTYDRMRKGILKQVLDNRKVNYQEVDITKLGVEEKKLLLESIIKTAEEDNENFLHKMRDRIDRVGIEIPKIEVRFENLSVERDAYDGTRALPTLINATLNVIEGLLSYIKILAFNKRVIRILKDVSGIVKPSRMTLLLGPPGSGKTTLLQALAGKMDKDLRVSGRVTYNGHEFSEFFPQRTCAYISQHDLHHGEMTVRETLDFSGRCLGVGTRYDMLTELSRREKAAGITPDPEIDAFMKVTSMEGQETSLVTDYILKILGLETCADILVGDEMRRGISGGQKKRLTTGEMLVGPAKALFMDGISTGLDSSTTFQIVSIGKQLHEEIQVPFDSSKTHHAALVKEKYGITKWELFKACFSSEWLFMKRSYFVYIFKTFQITIMSLITMSVFFRTKMEHGQLEDGGKFYGALFFSLVNVMFNGVAELAMTVNRLPVFFKQRDFLFYPAWTFALPIWVLRVPMSLLESGLWTILTYYTIGFAPAPSRFFRQLLAYFWVNQMALSLFRFIAAIGRTRVVSNTLASITILVVFVLSGFTVSRDDIGPWMIWCYYASPMMYGMTAITINEFLDERWSAPNIDPRIDEPTVGKALLKARGIFTEDYWYWISIGALIGFSLLFNVCFILALTYLDPFGSSKSIIVEEEDNRKNTTTSPEKTSGEMKEISATNVESFEGADMEVKNKTHSSIPKAAKDAKFKKGMVLPFQPLSLVFENVNYYIDMPNEMKQGTKEDRLQLLRDISGAFRPGILTALVGVSGAGKTTLMDVLSGRKTSGYIEGGISISGYPKNQATFARISGYCEQNDIHSPNITVYESLLFSAWLRLGKEVDIETRKMFIEEVIELVELHLVRNFLVGLPGIDGLSTEQRKRLTIAVELVANPSIIFMDEPTTGLDARAAAVVMRTVRNTVDTGRTVVCTIHQPSIDIFENFDELLLMKTGGQVIYGGPLGRNSDKLIEYFEAITGIPKIEDGYNPATWMLDISSPVVESQLNIDFAELYNQSSLYQRNQELIKELSIPAPGTKELYFPSKYSQSFVTQCNACFWKQYCSYWRTPQYNGIKYFVTIVIGVLFGLIYWKKGDKLEKEQDLLNLIGAMYSSVIFLGASNTSSVQPIVAIERTVLYRERAAGLYSELPYAIGQVAIEVIYVALQSLIYSIILYWMIGFEPQVENFFWFYFFIFMSFIYFTLYGMMTVALTPNHQIAAIVMSFFLSFWNLFSGFLIPRTQIPIWWRWYYWASPVAWTIYGLVTSQVGDNNNPIEVPGYRLMTVKDYLERQLGFEYDFLGFVALAHIAFCLLFLFVFAYGIKFLNFQKR